MYHDPMFEFIFGIILGIILGMTIRDIQRDKK